MNAENMPTVTINEISALIDGQLPTQERARILGLLAHDRPATSLLSALADQSDELRRLNVEVLHEEVPASLRAVVESGRSPRRSLALLGWRWGGLAAGILLAFGMGWLSQSYWSQGSDSLVASGKRAPQEFGRQAALAYVAYAPEVRHPVEVAAADQQHLVQWLSKRMGRSIRVPELSNLGYQLMGGRLLPGAFGARAQFMYQTASGGRLTLYIGAIESDFKSAASPNMETAFKFGGDGPVPTFYWVDKGFGYALSGPLSRTDLMAVAEAVYQQL